MHGMMPFIDLANETGCHIMLLHHTGKADGEGGDAVIGSEGYFGSVDTLLILKGRKRHPQHPQHSTRRRRTAAHDPDA
ncbi:MAG TPA: hypothetical protein VF953_00115 [Terriglobales bacterium]